MSEEEKKAIKELKDYLKTYTDKSIKIVLNLIEKQQKELELNNECEIALNNRILDLENELNKEKEKNKELENADLTSVYMSGFYDGEKKWKDKIRALIKENVYPDTYNFKTISAKRLEKLLEE